MKNLKKLSKRTLAMFLSLIMCLGMLPGTALAAETQTQTSKLEGDGVPQITKTVKYENGQYSVQMEAFVTGEVTTTMESVPTDIVLVLDQSGSMKETFTGAGKAYVALSSSTNKKAYSNRNNLYVKNSDGTYTKVSVNRKNDWGTYRYTYSAAGWSSQTSSGQNSQPPTGWDLYTYADISRLDALKNAVNAFVENVETQAKGPDETVGTEDDVNHRIAVVGFARTSTKSYENSELFIGDEEYRYDLIQAANYANALQPMNTSQGVANVNASIGELTAEGGTYVDLGIGMANGVFSNNPIPENETRNRVVIVFTDGAPGYDGEYANGTYGYSGDAAVVAQTAIAGAQQTKDTYGAKVYTVGIFDGADQTSAGSDSGSNATQRANWFMQNLSSNEGKVPGEDDPKYYLSASDPAALNNIFTTISESITSPDVRADSTAVLYDTMSNFFALPENAQTTATVQIVPCTGKSGNNYTWGTPVAAPSDVSVTVDRTTKTVSVTGFDYSSEANCVKEKTDGSYGGNKLVLTFPIIPDVNCTDWGTEGNSFTTNSAAGFEGVEEWTVPNDGDDELKLNVNTYTVEYQAHGLPSGTYYDAAGNQAAVPEVPVINHRYIDGQSYTAEYSMAEAAARYPQVLYTYDADGNIDKVYEFQGWAHGTGKPVDAASAQNGKIIVTGKWEVSDAPRKPSEEDLTGMFSGKVLVVCDNLYANHAAQPFGWTNGNTVTPVRVDGNGRYTVNVKLVPNAYTIQYHIAGTTHDAVDSKNLEVTIKLVWNAEEQAWERETAAVVDTPDATFYVDCHHPGLTVTYYDTDATGGTVPVDPNRYAVNASATILGNTGDLERIGYTWGGWADASGNAYAGTITLTDNLDLYPVWNPSTATQYTVKHYFENLDGTYPDNPETEGKSGTTGQLTAAVAQNKEGFTAQPFEQATIAPDGTTVVEIYYIRNTHTITWRITGEYFATPAGASYHQQLNVKYGAALTQLTDDMSQPGYLWKGWSDLPATMPDNDVEVTGHYETDPHTAYTVKHFQENLTGGYTEVPDSAQTLHGTTGTQTSATANRYDGFTAQTVTQQIIAADGSTVVEIYYDRNSCPITYQITGSYFTNPSYYTENVKFGTPLSLIQDNMVQPGYVWSGWNGLPDTMPAEPVTVAGSYSLAEDTPYKIEYYQQNLYDNDYTRVDADTQEFTGVTGEHIIFRPHGYSGFHYVGDEGDTVIKADGSSVVRLYFDRNTFTITYKVTGEFFANDSYVVIQNVRYDTPVSSLNNLPTDNEMAKVGYTWSNWSGLPAGTVTSDVTVIGSYGARADTKYTVKHMWQNLTDDLYTEHQSVDFSGTTGQLTNAQPIDYSGFTAQNFAQETIEADGSTVVFIYYDRNKHNVTYQIEGNYFADAAFDSFTGVKFGADFPSCTKPVEKAGYIWSGWKWNNAELPTTMPDQDVVVTGSYTPMSDITYTVVHYQQNLTQDDYDLADTETKAGTTGELTAAEAKQYPGFVAQSFQQAAIAGDGFTVVRINYNRNPYQVSYDFNQGIGADGVDYTPTSVLYGAEVTVKANPTREDYDFIGWQYGTNTYSEGETFFMPAEDVVLVAQWKPSKEELTVSKVLSTVNGAVAAPSGRVNVDDELVYTITIRNSGNVDLYNIDVADELTGESWTIASLPAGSIETREAHYQVKPEDAGTELTNVAVAKAPDEGPSNSGSETVDVNSEYTLTYNMNGGIGGPVTSDTRYQSGDTAMLSETAVHEAQNGTPVLFVGWSRTPDARIYTRNDILPVDLITRSVTFEDSDIVVYAVWGLNENSNTNDEPDVTETRYTVTYRQAGNTNMTGDVTISNLLTGMAIPGAPSITANVGYVLSPAGWALASGRPGANGTIGTTDLVYTMSVSVVGPYFPDPTPTPTPGPGPVNIPDTNPPLDDGTTIIDEDIPLAGTVGLNDTDHFAYIIGYEDDTVRPLNNITRAEVATIFFRLMTEVYRVSNWSTTNSFSDVKAGDWYNNAISTCANAGALKGYEDGRFRPNASITRAEFAAIAARFLSDEYTDDGVGDFSDTANHWAAAEIRLAAKAGWIKGDGNTFRPNDPITRAEVMTIVNRMLDRIPDADHMLPTMKKWIDNPEDAWYYEAVQEATNEHDYERDEMGVVETWTELLSVRDWKALEAEWAANGGSSAPAAPVQPAEGESGAESAEGETENA